MKDARSLDTAGRMLSRSALVRRRRRRRHLATLIVLTALVLAVVGYDAAALSAQHRSQVALSSTRAALVRTGNTLATTDRRVDRITAERDARREAQIRTTSEIGATDQSIDRATQARYLQSIDIGSLHTCLSGVTQAVNAIGAADLGAAVSSIDGASSSCLSLDGSTTGLVYPYDFPDPFILPVGGQYYGFATNSVAGNIQIIQSSDLTHWTTVGNALPHEPSWARPNATWAPSVLQRGSTFVLYYSAVYAPTGEECISEAVADQPQGPYVDNSTFPLMCQTALGGSIDPAPFVDTDGIPYLVWKSQGTGGGVSTLWSQQLTADGTALVPGPATPLLSPSLGWQDGVVEGPSLVLTGGRYLLFYSASVWQTDRYSIGVAQCTGPLGPCHETSTQPLLASGPSFSGPGGPSVFTDPQGKLWMAFHAWLPAKVGYPNSRLLFIRPISLVGRVVSVQP